MAKRGYCPTKQKRKYPNIEDGRAKGKRRAWRSYDKIFLVKLEEVKVRIPGLYLCNGVDNIDEVNKIRRQFSVLEKNVMKLLGVK